MYSWTQVAQRTVRVYDAAMTSTRSNRLADRLQQYYTHGLLFSAVCCLVMLMDYVLWLWIVWWNPAELFDIAPDMPNPCTIVGEQSRVAKCNQVPKKAVMSTS